MAIALSRHLLAHCLTTEEKSYRKDDTFSAAGLLVPRRLNHFQNKFRRLELLTLEVGVTQ